MSKRPPQGPAFIRYFQLLLDALTELDGSGTPAEVRDIIVERVGVGDDELGEQLKDGSSRFANFVAWARFYLVKAGYLESSKRGVWSLTAKGRTATLSHEDAYRVFKEVHSKWQSKKMEPARLMEEVSPEEAAESADGSHREQLMAAITGLSPSGFEKLCQRLLRESGFSMVRVTGKSGDGGIDGHGVVQVNPFVSFRVLFQCKKYTSSPVTPSQVRDFRGAMQGRADKGIILTTGTFTSEAKKEAGRDGVPPIELVDGEALMSMFETLELGLKPKIVFDVDEEFFEEFRDIVQEQS